MAPLAVAAEPPICKFPTPSIDKNISLFRTIVPMNMIKLSFILAAVYLLIRLIY